MPERPHPHGPPAFSRDHAQRNLYRRLCGYRDTAVRLHRLVPSHARSGIGSRLRPWRRDHIAHLCGAHCCERRHRRVPQPPRDGGVKSGPFGTEDPGKPGRRGGGVRRSAVLLVHHLPEADGGILDVEVLRRADLGDDKAAAVNPLEVAIRELVPGLGVLGRLVVHAEVPVGVLVPAAGLDELVLRFGRRLVLAPTGRPVRGQSADGRNGPNTVSTTRSEACPSSSSMYLQMKASTAER